MYKIRLTFYCNDGKIFTEQIGKCCGKECLYELSDSMLDFWWEIFSLNLDFEYYNDYYEEKKELGLHDLYHLSEIPELNCYNLMFRLFVINSEFEQLNEFYRNYDPSRSKRSLCFEVEEC